MKFKNYSDRLIGYDDLKIVYVCENKIDYNNFQ